MSIKNRYIIRGLIITSCIVYLYNIFYILLFINVDIDSLSLFIPAAIIKYISTSNPGSEWIVLSITNFIVGLILWHTIFFSLWRRRDNTFLFGIIPKFIPIKLIDYIWYTLGLVSIVLTISGINYENNKSLIDKYQTSWKNHVFFIKKYKKKHLNESCETILKSYDSFKHIENIGVFKKICTEIDYPANLSSINKICSLSKNDWDWDSTTTDNFSGRYFYENNIPHKLKNSLDSLDLICTYLKRINFENKQIKLYEKSSNIFLDTPEKRKIIYLIFLPLLVSLRLVKTTIEFSSAWHEYYKNKDIKKLTN